MIDVTLLLKRKTKLARPSRVPVHLRCHLVQPAFVDLALLRILQQLGPGSYCSPRRSTYATISFLKVTLPLFPDFYQKSVRTKTQLNGAEAPVLFCPETQSWCVIKHKARHFVRAIAEMCDHTQEKIKNKRKDFFPRTECGSKCFWQRINSIILSQNFVRDLFGSKSRIRGSVTLSHMAFYDVASNI